MNTQLVASIDSNVEIRREELKALLNRLNSQQSRLLVLSTSALSVDDEFYLRVLGRDIQTTGRELRRVFSAA